MKFLPVFEAEDDDREVTENLRIPVTEKEILCISPKPLREALIEDRKWQKKLEISSLRLIIFSIKSRNHDYERR